MAYVAAIDIGGTHTDCVASDGRTVKVAKVPTTANPTEGVVNGVEMLADKFGTDLGALLGSCERFVYGSTTATNIFVQRRLPKIGLLCTEGHRDILWFREGNKPDRWNLRAPPPWSLLDRHLRRPVSERIDQAGEVVVPLAEQSVREAAGRLRDEGVEAVAIAFLWSFLNPAHERRAQEIAREELGDGVPVVASVDILPVIREWERTFCTVLSAGIMVETRAHLESFRDRMKELGLKGEPLVMQCNGGHATIDAILKNPLPLVASGPAGGALAGVYYGELTDSADVMTIDTGGTSFDVCVLPGRSIPITRGKRLENEPIAIPSVDVHTIGAGGGSIAWLDAGGALRVGPQSAGANPGPACYGRGGTEPTLTDAFVHLGYINPDYFLGGRTALQPTLADRAIQEKIAAPLGLDVTGAAARIVEIMNSRLAGAMGLLSVERGIDPRPYTLLVGGGAGPLQACTLASRLGIARVIVPRWPGVLCASGLMRADVTAQPGARLQHHRRGGRSGQALRPLCRDGARAHPHAGGGGNRARGHDAPALHRRPLLWPGLRNRDAGALGRDAHAGPPPGHRRRLRGCPRYALPLPHGGVSVGIRYLPGGGDRAGRGGNAGGDAGSRAGSVRGGERLPPCLSAGRRALRAGRDL